MSIRTELEATWEALVPIELVEVKAHAADVVDLMARAGLQVGIGEGRPDGLGWGRFKVKES